MSKPAGLALGRVVHYATCPKRDDAQLIPVLGGRVSRIHNAETGVVTIHCDKPLDPNRAPGREWALCMNYVVSEVHYDESGAPGTWRYPPRVG